MPRPMTAKDFNKLSKRDFDNGAITDEIHAALTERESLVSELTALRSLVREYLEAKKNRSFQTLGGNRHSRQEADERLEAAHSALRSAVSE